MAGETPMIGANEGLARGSALGAGVAAVGRGDPATRGALGLGSGVGDGAGLPLGVADGVTRCATTVMTAVVLAAPPVPPGGVGQPARAATSAGRASQDTDGRATATPPR